MINRTTPIFFTSLNLAIANSFPELPYFIHHNKQTKLQSPLRFRIIVVAVADRLIIVVHQSNPSITMSQKHDQPPAYGAPPPGAPQQAYYPPQGGPPPQGPYDQQQPYYQQGPQMGYGQQPPPGAYYQQQGPYPPQGQYYPPQQQEKKGPVSEPD